MYYYKLVHNHKYGQDIYFIKTEQELVAWLWQNSIVKNYILKQLNIVLKGGYSEEFELIHEGNKYQLIEL